MNRNCYKGEADVHSLAHRHTTKNYKFNYTTVIDVPVLQLPSTSLFFFLRYDFGGHLNARRGNQEDAVLYQRERGREHRISPFALEYVQAVRFMSHSLCLVYLVCVLAVLNGAVLVSGRYQVLTQFPVLPLSVSLSQFHHKCFLFLPSFSFFHVSCDRSCFFPFILSFMPVFFIHSQPQCSCLSPSVSFSLCPRKHFLIFVSTCQFDFHVFRRPSYLFLCLGLPFDFFRFTRPKSYRFLSDFSVCLLESL